MTYLPYQAIGADARTQRFSPSSLHAHQGDAFRSDGSTEQLALHYHPTSGGHPSNSPAKSESDDFAAQQPRMYGTDLPQALGFKLGAPRVPPPTGENKCAGATDATEASARTSEDAAMAALLGRPVRKKQAAAAITRMGGRDMDDAGCDADNDEDDAGDGKAIASKSPPTG